MAHETLSIYLLKPSVGAAREALRADVEELSEHHVDAGETQGTLFVAEAEPHEPDWVRLLGPVTTPPVSDQTQSTRALLVLRSAGRWFAIAFGHGRHLLDRGAYERRFGLRVVLNAVDPEKLRSAQARTFGDHALHTQRQLSRMSRVEALGLDVQRDLVTALAGLAADPTLGVRIDGRDAVRLTAEIQPRDIAAKCAQLLAESERTAYRDHFPFIDTIEEVVDPDEIERLERRAATALGQRQFARFDLFPPELVPAEIVEYRLYPSQGGLVVIEPDSSLLRFPLRGPTAPDAAQRAVRRYRLIGLDADGQQVDRWSFWDCLHYEELDGNVMLVLDSGNWYRIEQHFASDVNQFAASLKASRLTLPPARRNEYEADYNARAARSAGLALLDKQNIVLPGQSAIEPCDLFSRDRHLVHVKRRKGGSAPLSHLFGQALVSAECLLSEAAFRTELRSKLDNARHGFGKLVQEPPDARNFHVVLAFMTNQSSTGRVAQALPFFSKVFLRQTVQALHRMNFEVSVDEIPVDALAPRRKRGRPRRTPGVKQPARAGR